MRGRRRLRITTMRRGDDRVIAGVASGVAHALRVDPIIARVGFVALVGGRQGFVRLAIGAVLVFSGIGVFLAANDALGAARQVGLAIVVTIAGLAVILGPWIRRLLTELGDERRERIRSEERADVAA